MTPVARLENLRPDQLKEALQRSPSLVLPIGTIEWHGHHLPLGLDGIKASAVAQRVAERVGAVLAPVTYWAAGGVSFPFTLRLDQGLCTALYAQVLCQFASMGFRAILVVNGHFGLANSVAVRRAAISCMADSAATVLVMAEYEVLLDLGDRGDHAGLWETALLRAVRPELVDEELLETDAELSGVIGADPREGASPELGPRGLHLAAMRMAASIRRSLTESSLRRTLYVESLISGTAALEAIAEMRSKPAMSPIPPVATPAWFHHLRAIHGGDYVRARRFAEQKLADPRS